VTRNGGSFCDHGSVIATSDHSSFIIALKPTVVVVGRPNVSKSTYSIV
jgi:hypothetical protein